MKNVFIRFPLFGITCVLVFAALLPGLSAQRLLYSDAGIRGRVEQALETIAEEEGLLLSGFSIRSLTGERLMVRYRDYTHGDDALSCFVIDLSSLSHTACDVSASS